MPEGYYIPDLTLIRNMLDSLEDETTESQKSAIFEKYEGMIFVDFVPTSENLAAWLLSVVQEKMKNLPGVRVKAVEYWETPKSHCRVEA
jgi:6-pyruvoyltetrahydropterin/6-carboxytetrahydropterin synthase